MLSSNNPHRPRDGSGFHTRDGHSKFKIQDCFTNSQLWTFPVALDSIGILFQVIRIPRNSLPTHSASLAFFSKDIRILRNSLPTHPALFAFFSKLSGSLGILYQRTRLHWHSFPKTSGPLRIFYQHTRLRVKIAYSSCRTPSAP